MTVTKADWIDALRSGEYRQHQGALSNANIAQELDKATAFCCIGVLAKIAGMKKQTPETSAYDLASTLTHGHQGRLVVMNDKEHKSFAEIADYLEALP